MSKDTMIIILRLNNDLIEPLAWTDTNLSKRELRRATRKFRNNKDVKETDLVPWYRIYHVEADAKKLPRY